MGFIGVKMRTILINRFTFSGIYGKIVTSVFFEDWGRLMCGIEV
jgi:hypothetical protein